MQLSYAPYCPKCDSGNKKRVLIIMPKSDGRFLSAQDEPTCVCGSCFTSMERGPSMLVDDARVVAALSNLIGAFELVEFGSLDASLFVVLEAREAPGYKVEISVRMLFDETIHGHGNGRVDHLPHVLKQAASALKEIGFRVGSARWRDHKEHWICLERTNIEGSRLYCAKLIWPCA